MKPDQPKEFEPFPKLKYPLTPYQLFSPVSSVFKDNITYEEQLLGLYKRFNEFVETYNNIIQAVAELQELYETIPGQIQELQAAINTLNQAFTTKILEVITLITTTADNILKLANDYTDKQIALHYRECAYGALTAEEYDSLQLAAVDYDDYGMSAYEYDTRAKWILFGQDGAIYYKFIPTLSLQTGDVIADLSKAPIKLGKRYKIEVYLGKLEQSMIVVNRVHIQGINDNPEIDILDKAGGFGIGVFQSPPGLITYSGSFDSGNNQWIDNPTLNISNGYVKIIPLGELK